jgi:hypothetical protein
MNKSPVFNYYLSDRAHPAAPETNRWQRFLPLNRQAGSAGEIPDQVVTYGDYFGAIRTFLKQNDFAVISAAAKAYDRLQHSPVKSNKSDKPDAIEAIDIFAVKHGAFYHPAQIKVAFDQGQTLSLVLNVAISVAGQQTIESEFKRLKRLQEKKIGQYTPQVYCFGHTDKAQGILWPMFLGQWFDDFHEFHLTIAEPDGYKMVAWDPHKGPQQLKTIQMATLYRQVAAILTNLYRIETFEQVFPWHHAAGDFVVNIKKVPLEVKLITIRRFGPLFELPTDAQKAAPEPGEILDALLIFFLNLSMRMRLDRLDGTGDVVWADDTALVGTWEGFFAALVLKPKPAMMPVPMSDAFAYVLAITPKNDLFTMSLTIAKRIYAKTAEFNVIRQNLKGHIDTLYRLINILEVAVD